MYIEKYRAKTRIELLTGHRHSMVRSPILSVLHAAIQNYICVLGKPNI